MTDTQASQWVWDSKSKTYVANKDLLCHEGNTAIYVEPKGGTLFIGGWTKGAVVTNNTHVIDLTGLEHRYYEMPIAYDKNSLEFLQFTQACKGWLSLPFPDYGTPHSLTTYAQWKGIANTIQMILRQGTDVLVACHGGHGRSGLFCAIVGYILGINSNRAWSSPVEHIRSIHCEDTVETIAQEKFVYGILGLNIQISHNYPVVTTTSNDKYIGKLQKCPICGTQSVYIEAFGMCLGCQSKFTPLVRTVEDLTEQDISNPITHDCVNGDKCVGIYKASKCGHVVHDMIICEGYCENCHWDMEQAEKTVNLLEKGKEIDPVEDDNFFGACVMCHRESHFGKIYGICYDCQVELKEAENVDYVHNSITDPYRAVPHGCDNVVCVGVVAGDICKHVVHNLEIEDGLCPDCKARRE